MSTTTDIKTFKINYLTEAQYNAAKDNDQIEPNELYVTPSGISSGVSNIGEIRQFAGSTAPVNWLICDGSAVSRATYSELFAVIGTTYGAGNGSTTFNIPDLRGRFPIGADTTYAIGSTGGEASHTLTIDEIPSHNHGLPYWVGNGTAGTGGNGIWMQIATTKQTEDAGGGEAHNNMPPYLGVNYIICYRADNSTTSVDYIVDQGTSGDWTYRKWNSGIVEGWYSQNVSVSVDNAYGYAYYHDYPSSVPYPTMFISHKTISADWIGGDNLIRIIPVGKSGNYLRIYSVAPNNIAVSGTLCIYMMGKWK